MIDIIPIKDLKNTATISERVHKTNSPIYITKNGYGDMVIMSIESYQKFLYDIHLAKELNKAENEIKEGKIYASEDIIKEMEDKYGI